MADHSKPTLSSNYTSVLSELDSRFDDLSQGLDPAVTTATNLATNSIRWSSVANKWEKFNGTSWNDLSSAYSININGTVGATNPSTGAFTTLSATTSATLPANTTINGSAAVSLNATQTLTNKTIGSGSSWTGGTIAIAYGGTNTTTSPTAGAVAVGNGTAYAFTAVGTSGQVLISNGSSTPTWSSSLSLTSLNLSSNLAVNGGTISSSAATGSLFDTPTTLTLGSAATGLTIGATSGTITLRNPTIATSVNTGTLTLFGGVTTGTINLGSNSAGKFDVRFTTASSSATTGALTVGGGIGVSGVSYFGNDLFMSGTGAIKVPSGTTAQRPTGSVGKIRFNSDLNRYEGYNGSSWSSIGGGATGGGSDQIFIENGQVITSDYTISSTTNAGSFGPITINDGVTVTVADGGNWIIV